MAATYVLVIFILAANAGGHVVGSVLSHSWFETEQACLQAAENLVEVNEKVSPGGIAAVCVRGFKPPDR